MKKLVLLACLVPCLSFARQVPDHLHRFFDRSLPSAVQLRSAGATLDSTYMYQGDDELLTDIYCYMYDETGFKTTEFRKSGYSTEGSQKITSKTEYSVPENPKPGFTEIQEFAYIYNEGEWQPVSKTFNRYNDLSIQVCMREYVYNNGEWVKNWVSEAVEYKGNLPLVVMDSTFNSDGTVDVMKLEAVYDGGTLPASGKISYWDPASSEWIVREQAHLTYDDQGNTIRQYTEIWEEGAWKFGFEYTWEYDERGNMTREYDKEEDQSVYTFRYQNFYSDGVATHTDPIPVSNPLQVRLNPSSRTLHIDLAEETTGKLTIVNAAGIVMQQTVVRDRQTDLPVSSWPAGYYIVHLSTSRGVLSQQVIIR